MFSGVARAGQRVHILSAAYNPAQPELQRQTVVITDLYLMMGRALERLRVSRERISNFVLLVATLFIHLVLWLRSFDAAITMLEGISLNQQSIRSFKLEMLQHVSNCVRILTRLAPGVIGTFPRIPPAQEVPSGNVLAIAGLATAILKSATLCSSPACRPLAPMTFQAAPIVRVALEPARAIEMPALEEGLRLLNRADPFVEVSVMVTGEHVLSAAGEVHLETCIKDLRERFARIQLQVSVIT